VFRLECFTTNGTCGKHQLSLSLYQSSFAGQSTIGLRHMAGGCDRPLCMKPLVAAAIQLIQRFPSALLVSCVIIMALGIEAEFEPLEVRAHSVLVIKRSLFRHFQSFASHNLKFFYSSQPWWHRGGTQLRHSQQARRCLALGNPEDGINRCIANGLRRHVMVNADA
jgi:hypothetical protein